MILSQGYKNVHNTTIVVIGGGAAGLAAAVNAAKSEFSVTIIDQNEQFGAKLLLTGGGHCNFSHAGTVEDLVAGFHGQGRFLYSALSRYGRDEYIRFLNGCGVRVTSDPSGRWLPSGGRATDVRDAFVTKVRQLGVRQLMSMRARTIKRVGDTWELDLQTNDAHTRLTARAVIIATGTAAYPSVGGVAMDWNWPGKPATLSSICQRRWLQSKSMKAGWRNLPGSLCPTVGSAYEGVANKCWNKPEANCCSLISD